MLYISQEVYYKVNSLRLGSIWNEMRDIRQDLVERLNALSKELESLALKTKSVQDERASLLKLLEAENLRFHAPAGALVGAIVGAGGLGGQVTSALAQVPAKTALGHLIWQALSDGKPHSLGEIKDFVTSKRYQFGGASPSRAINFRLLGLKNADRVIRVRLPSGGIGWQLKLEKG